MPSISIQFFGPARDLTGERAVRWTIEEKTTVGMIAGKLAETFPRLGAAVGLRLAVNRAYVPLDYVLVNGDEIAVIPPVSGGSEGPYCRLTREAIDAQRLIEELSNHDSGATNLFLGTVRAETSGSRVLAALEYEAYDVMALEQMEAIRRRAMEKYGAVGAVIVHRLGQIALGEASIAVVVVTAHRSEGFDACRYMVDAVKTDVPIWKKNIWSDGSGEWVEPAC